MSYITSDDQKTLVPAHVIRELTDDDAEGIANLAIVDEVIKEACEEVDGYLRGRYSLPFAKTPTLVKSAAKQIARYMLYERRPEGFELPPAVVDGRKIAIKNLEKIRDGLISLGVSEGELQGRILDDDGEFHVSVRPSQDRMSNFGRDVLDRY
ncbi:gp436 family protein [Psychrobacter lutiphocae]|uniref:gp436 family protein n=1 Tax=Psychrobacter lutiphocae TaxID=540500 RepID=UPI00037E0D6A|nr:DUF1320 domain-containing protein [Psychrobacter lutiphocae]